MLLRRSGFARIAALTFTLLASACGGGGGTTSTPAPPVAPTPAPTPTPTPTPAPSPTPTPSPTLSPTLTPSDIDTAEYRRSDGPAFHNAAAAWQLGATGKDVAIGIVDSGIDTANPEFAGRIGAASADVAAARGVQAEGDHGTNVALVAAAARNGSGVVGIAYEATILAMRADSPGSCATYQAGKPETGCRFGDTAIAAGVDRATQAGAKVINISLGGSTPGSVLRSAIGRAAAAGVVVVVSAGNDADDPPPGADPNNPDSFAMGLRAAGNGNVIIAGSVDEGGAISAFSNRAGNEAQWYLMAAGQAICCVYENGAIKTTTTNGQNFVRVFSGTSFSAPQIAGAAALLRQAFPNLTATQTVDLLLRTARDAGTAGTDAIYGRGVLDIARAFAPQGTTALAGTTTSLAVGADTGTTSPAMGDAATGASALSATVLDSYGRAYRLALGPGLTQARPAMVLGGALAAPARSASGGTRAVTLAFTVSPASSRTALASDTPLQLGGRDAAASRLLAANVVARLSPQARAAFAFGQDAQGLSAGLAGVRPPAFLIAGAGAGASGFGRSSQISAAVRRGFGPWGLTLSAGSARIDNPSPFRSGDVLRTGNFGRASEVALRLDRSFGPLALGVGADWLREGETVLGGRFDRALVAGGADSLFLDLDAALAPAAGWRIGAGLRQGWTRPHGGANLAGGSRLVSQAWSLDVARDGVFQPADRLALRVAQPLRVGSGGLRLNLPSGWSYDTLEAARTVQVLGLAPRGREVASELAWTGTLLGGSARASAFWRTDPGHVARARDEKGVAMLWSKGF